MVDIRIRIPGLGPVGNIRSESVPRAGETVFVGEEGYRVAKVSYFEESDGMHQPLLTLDPEPHA